jgi:predicted nuclease of predicted toxin-antitoxin system
MRVLLDECTPKALKASLVAHGHECLTVQEAGWSGKENGELLGLAERQFDALVTLDTNLPYQQNLEGRRIAILVIVARSNRLDYLKPYFEACAMTLETIKPGEMVYVGEKT